LEIGESYMSANPNIDLDLLFDHEITYICEVADPMQVSIRIVLRDAKEPN
jgi:hypothetical protein